MKAANLKTEHMDAPCGIGYSKPYLSWNCEGGKRQTAYEVCVEANGKAFWNSGIRKRAEMHCVCGRGIPSRARVKWRVRLWDEDDRLHWGLLICPSGKRNGSIPPPKRAG